MENDDFKTQLASIFSCYSELQDLVAGHCHHEDVTSKAEALGEDIRSVPWTGSSLEYLLALFKQDVPHILEAIQMVRHLSLGI
jgi:hypothetical protein